MSTATAPGLVGAPAPAPPHLTRTMVRLKLRLLRNRARRGRALLQLVLGALYGAVFVALGSTAAFAAARADDQRLSHAAVVIAATVMFAIWTIMPLLTFGTDESLDPSRLVLFPIPVRSMMRSLLVASLVGIAPTMAVSLAVVVAIAYAKGASFVIGLVAALLLVLLCAACARAVSTTLGAGLQSRKGRDAVAIGGAAMFLGVQGLRFVNWGAVSTDLLDRIAGILRWLPPGMLGQAVVDSRTGHVGVALLELVPAIVAIPLLLRAWAWALDRSATVVRAGQTAPTQRSARAGLAILFPRLPFIRATPWGAVAARELRYVARHPRRKVTLFNSVVIGVGGPIFLVVKNGGIGSVGVLLAAAAGYILVIGSSNQFGTDGGAFWTDVVSPVRVRDLIVGKNVAALVEILPVTVVAGVALAAITGGWAYLPAALVLTVAGLGSGFATANVLSVLMPFRVPETTNPFGGTGGGQGCATGALVMVGLVVQSLVLAPVAAAAAIAATVAPASLVVVCPLCAVYGAGVYVAGLSIAERYGRAHLPEILDKVHPSRDG